MNLNLNAHLTRNWGIRLCLSLALLLYCTMTSLAQARKVSGRVVDDAGKPLPNINVTIKGKSGGTFTDVNGYFTIPADNGEELKFSSIGFKTQSYMVGAGQDSITIKLPADFSTLSDVVVVGYGTQKKATLTGAVAAVTSKEIVTTRNENLQNMLTGKLAGVRVVQNSSEPGAFSNTFDIRGLGSPLIIIDGVPRDNMSAIDPQDVESISVLKDASAAVYGVRAANGVLLITTKKGKSGTAEINYTGDVGWQVPSNMPKSTSALDYMMLRNERTMHNPNGGTLTFSDADMKPYIDGTKSSSDWYKATISNSVPQTQHNIGVSGGTDRITYYASLGYLYQGGMYRSNDLFYNRYNLRSNVNAKITRNLTMDLNASYIVGQTNKPVTDAIWIVRSVWRQSALQPIYANNDPNYLAQTVVDGTNPIAYSNSNVSGGRINKNNWLQSSLALHYQVPGVDGLKLNGMFSYDYNTSSNKIYVQQYNQYTYDAASSSYKAYTVNSANNIRREFYEKPIQLMQVSANYDKVFDGKHAVNALILGEQSYINNDNFWASRDLNLQLDQLFAGNSLNTQAGQDLGNNNLGKYTYQALVGKFNYAFEGKYLAEFSFRYDGSSKNAPSNRFGFFPGASIGWRISDENFWKNSSSLKFINNLKVRASYGKLGDDRDSWPNNFTQGYFYPAGGNNNTLPGGSVFDGTFVGGVQNKGLVNSNFTWYTSKSLDFGIDIEAWQGLLGLTVDVFRRDRSGLLATRAGAVPDVVGVGFPQENLNSDRTQGIDLEISHRNHVGEFTYGVKGTFGYTRTKNINVVRARAGNPWDDWRNNPNNRWNNILFGYGAAGRYTSWDQIQHSPVYVDRGTLPGDYMYQDWDGDGQITDNDKHPVAYGWNPDSNVPLVTFGLNLNVAWKGIDLNMLWQGATLCNTAYMEQLYEPMWGDPNANALSQFLDRWHPVDPKANPYDPSVKWVQGSYAYTGTLPYQNSMFNVKDASYLRLKSIDIGYSIPARLYSRVGIKNLRVFANGYDLLTFSGLKFVDPEHPSGQKTDGNGTTYGYLYPLMKKYAVGLNVRF